MTYGVIQILRVRISEAWRFAESRADPGVRTDGSLVPSVLVLESYGCCVVSDFSCLHPYEYSYAWWVKRAIISVLRVRTRARRMEGWKDGML